MTEYISKEVARRIIDSERSKEQMLQMLDNVPPSAESEIIRCKDCVKCGFYGNGDKYGTWHILDDCANEGVYCSKCHKKVFKYDFSNTMKWKNFKYCPNCGVPMMKGEKDESL